MADLFVSKYPKNLKRLKIELPATADMSKITAYAGRAVEEDGAWYEIKKFGRINTPIVPTCIAFGKEISEKRAAKINAQFERADKIRGLEVQLRSAKSGFNDMQSPEQARETISRIEAELEALKNEKN